MSRVGTELPVRESVLSGAGASAKLDFVDNMRAIAIVLVVLGHAPGIDRAIIDAVYGFHMPLFFFLSGFLLRPDKLALAPGAYLRLLGKRLLLPYVFFVALSYLYWLLTRGVSSKAAEYSALAWYEPVYFLFRGYDHAANIGLWFFTCLMAASLAYYLLRRYFPEKTVLIVIAASSLGFMFAHRPSWPRLPWCVDVAVVALLFYAAGHYCSGGAPRFSRAPSKAGYLALALAALILSAGLTAFNGPVNLYDLNFGNHPVLFVAGAAAGIVAVWLVSVVLPASGVRRWLGGNTIMIFPTHALMFSVFTGIGVTVFGFPYGFKDSSAVYGLIYAGLALALSYPTAQILYRLFPFVFGKRLYIE